jgi:RimJ/RimL family protein N-acetyltransferase
MAADLRPSYREFEAGRDDEALIDLLTTEDWPLRMQTQFSRAEVEQAISSGEYGAGKDLTFLIEIQGDVVGLVRLESVGEPRFDPALDIRFREAWRGRGLGVEAVRYITDEYFRRFPASFRIEGQTRRDNLAMRTVFERAGWVKEAVYRAAWEPDENGRRLDGLGYAILRSDWGTGTRTEPDFSAP